MLYTIDKTLGCKAERELDGTDAEAFEVAFQTEGVVEIDSAHRVDEVDAVEEDILGGGKGLLTVVVD